MTDASPGGFEGACVELAQEGLELGEDLFDRIEVGRVSRQEQKLGSSGTNGAADGLRLWLPRLSMMTMSPGRSVGTSICST